MDEILEPLHQLQILVRRHHHVMCSPAKKRSTFTPYESALLWFNRICHQFSVCDLLHWTFTVYNQTCWKSQLALCIHFPVSASVADFLYFQNNSWRCCSLCDSVMNNIVMPQEWHIYISIPGSVICLGVGFHVLSVFIVALSWKFRVQLYYSVSPFENLPQSKSLLLNLSLLVSPSLNLPRSEVLYYPPTFFYPPPYFYNLPALSLCFFAPHYREVLWAGKQISKRIPFERKTSDYL